MSTPTIAIIETCATHVLGNDRLNSTLMRVAEGFSRRTRVLVACWHQTDLELVGPRLRPPLLEFEDGEYRVWMPRSAVPVDAMWHFPVAGQRRKPLTRDELNAEARFTAAGIRCGGITAETTSRILYGQARHGVPTNAPGPLGRLDRKDQLEYGLRWFARVSGLRIPRPETHPSTGAQVTATFAAFNGRDCIVKPANSGGGCGLCIVPAGNVANTWFEPTATFVVQELVRDPLLLAGCKVDLRCYLLVTTLDRARSRRVGPILVRSAPVAYERLRPEAEITNTSFRRRLGLGPSIRPLESAFADDVGFCQKLRGEVERVCEGVLDFVFTWRDEHAATEPPASQVMLWGIDLLPLWSLRRAATATPGDQCLPAASSQRRNV